MPRCNISSSRFRLLKKGAALALPWALALLAGNAASLAQEIEMRPHPEPPRINRDVDPMRPGADIELETERARRAFEGLDVEKRPPLGLMPGEIDLVNKQGHALGNGRAPFLLLPQDAPLHLHETLGNPPPAERGSADYYRWVQRSLNRDTLSPRHLLPEDGIFSEETRHAVRLFQARHGLAADGLIGDKTELALERVIRPTDSLLPIHHYPMPAWVDKSVHDWLNPPPTPPKRTTFLDVKNRNGRVSVSIYDEDSLYRSILDPRLSTIENRPVASSAELAGLLAGADTVIHSGDPLPKEWNSVVDDKATRLRHSNQSPKRFPSEYINAAQLLEQRASHDTVRVFTALPHETDRRALTRQLNSMGLDRREIDGWLALQAQMHSVQLHSGYTFEPATVEGITRELTEGKNNTIVLIAHHEDGMTILPNGERLSDQDFARLTRAVAPDRNLILISCETGTVNGRKTSLGEVLLKNKLAANVAAPPDPVSGQDVPGMLRDFLIGRKTIREVFSKLGFITDERVPRIGWQTDWELARLTMLPQR